MRASATEAPHRAPSPFGSAARTVGRVEGGRVRCSPSMSAIRLVNSGRLPCRTAGRHGCMSGPPATELRGGVVGVCGPGVVGRRLLRTIPAGGGREHSRGRWDERFRWAGLLPSGRGRGGRCFAVSATFAHRSASEVPDAQGFQPRQLLGFIRATLTHPYWLGGIALSTVGLGLHAFALTGGALAVVQLLMVLGVLFALPLQRRLRQERIPRNELLWALTLVVGLAGFLLVATAGVPAHTTEVAA